MSKKIEAVENARINFLSDTDGSGGSGKIGINDIAIAKRTEYLKLDKEYQALLKTNQPVIYSADASLQEIEKNIQQEETGFAMYLNNGFLTRVEALNNILQNNTALQYRYYLIIFILVLIELMPVIAKTLLPTGSYDEKVLLREEMEIDITGSNIRKEQQSKELYNQLAFDHDAETISSFFLLTKDDRDEK